MDRTNQRRKEAILSLWMCEECGDELKGDPRND